jgi:hypothetical protein
VRRTGTDAPREELVRKQRRFCIVLSLLLSLLCNNITMDPALAAQADEDSEGGRSSPAAAADAAPAAPAAAATPESTFLPPATSPPPPAPAAAASSAFLFLPAFASDENRALDAEIKVGGGGGRTGGGKGAGMRRPSSRFVSRPKIKKNARAQKQKK